MRELTETVRGVEINYIDFGVADFFSNIFSQYAIEIKVTAQQQ
jgi:hypothetical protein